MKRYSMQYISDKQIGTEYDNTSGRYVPSYNHIYGMASSIKVCKQYIARCKKKYADDHPRNFRIYDHYGEVDEETRYVPCVYQEP